jgi:hypothetical protein
MDKITSQGNHTVNEYIDSIDDERIIADSYVLIEIMQRISGHEPRLWNIGTIGFDTYNYKYDTGREGDSQIISFYPRKGKLTIYLMDGTARHAETLTRLGKHTTAGYCIYIKQLADIELPILEELLKSSYDYIKSLAQDGPINRILWQTEV